MPRLLDSQPCQQKTVHHNPPAFCKVCAQGPTNVVSCVMHTSCPRQEVRCEAEEEEEQTRPKNKNNNKNKNNKRHKKPQTKWKISSELIYSE